MFCKVLKSLVVWFALSVPALAQNTLYLNYVDKGNGEIHISQGYSKCTGNCVSVQLSSYSQTASELNKLFLERWNYSGNASARLSFDSDIDLGQYVSGKSTCVVNHTPLTINKNFVQIFGNNHTIKNLCYVKKVDYSANNAEMKDSVGFFKMLDTAWVNNLNFKNVYISVTDSKNASVDSKGHNYLPVGTLTGILKRTLVSGAVFENVKVSAPLAGGVAGYVENSTVENFTGKNISVFNEVDVNKNRGGAAGTRVIGWSGDYSAFIGGVAGLSLNLNLKNVNADVTVANKSKEKTVAAGGLVGLFAVSKQLNNNPQQNVVLENVNVGYSAWSNVFGAKTMGGFLGEAAMWRSEAGHAFDLVVRNSTFNGSVYSSGADSTYMGGFVGRSLLDRGSSLKILSSRTNAKLLDTLKTASKHGFYAGGFVGLGMGAPENAHDDVTLSFVNSKTSGEISVSKAAKVSGIRADVYLGGLAGAGFFAVNDSAFLADTSSMKISSLVSGTGKMDSVTVGGFVGRVSFRKSSSGASSLKVKKSKFAGNILVNDSLSVVRMGGFFGAYGGAGDYMDVSFENVQVQGNSVLAFNPSRKSVPVNGTLRMGGLCGVCFLLSNIDHASVVGNLEVGGNFANADSLQVGGFVGRVFNSSNDAFEIKNSYFVGNIGVDNATAELKKSSVGYLIGFLRMGYSETRNRMIVSTYHMGEDSFEPVGNFTNGSVQGGWKEVEQQSYSAREKWVVKSNIRNGSTKVELSELDNGKIPEANMKSSILAIYLNSPWAEENVWKQLDDANSGLPYFASETPGGALGSSSSRARSSSSRARSSSSVKSSSSSVKSSSSSAKSSSSSVKSSSSSYVRVPEFVSPSLKQSGNMVKLSFAARYDGSRKTSVILRVKKGEKLLKDSVLVNPMPKVLSKITWNWQQIPVGKYEVEVLLKNDKYSTPFKRSFEVAFDVSVTPKQWKLISLSHASNIKKLDLKKNDVLYGWNERTLGADSWQYYAFASGSKIDSAQGFWFSSLKGDTLKRKEDRLSDKTEFVWKLDSVYSGWNLVSNPHGWNVELPDLKANQIEVWRWNFETGEYEVPKYIEPYEGVWVKTKTAKKITLSGKPYFAKLDSAASLAKNVDMLNGNVWSLRAVLQDMNGKKDSWNTFGAGEAAEAEEPPAGMGDHVNLSIVEKGKMLAKSIREMNPEMEWTFMVSASDERLGYLNFEGLEVVKALGLKLFVTVDGYSKEVKVGESLPVLLKSSAAPVKVRVSSSDNNVESVDFAFKKIYRNGNNLNVAFKASENLAGQRGKVEILDVHGKILSSEKFSTVIGMNDVNLAVSTRGTYVLRVRVGSKSFARNIVVE